MRARISALLPLVAVLSFGASPRVDADPPIQPLEDPPAESGGSRSELAFACDLYRAVSAKDGNLFFSPFSVGSALAMARAGAVGETAKQMDAVLGTPKFTASDAYAGMGAAIASPRKVRSYDDGKPAEVPAYELSVANALWSQKGWAFKDPFRVVVREVHRAEFGELDFKDPPAARRAINDWVATNTKDKIKDIVPPGLPTPDTRLVLANAIYFKASWEEPFAESATQDGTFTVSAGNDVKARMMRRTNHFPYADAGDVQVLEIPYRGRETSMLIVLPKAKDGLAAATKDLSAARLSGWISALKHAKVALQMPKFEFTKDLSLSETLAAMGMSDAFDPTKAKFDGITDEKPLFLGAVLHKAFVAVDEKGTEAAAATVVMMRAGSAPRPEEPVAFTADHPFLFVILHKVTGAALFVGRVADPTKSD